jgi:hypothetical protein
MTAERPQDHVHGALGRERGLAHGNARPAAGTIPHPRLRVCVPLEGHAEVNFRAHSFEDELALWNGYLDDIATVLVRLLDDLDASAEEHAA